MKIFEVIVDGDCRMNQLEKVMEFIKLGMSNPELFAPSNLVDMATQCIKDGNIDNQHVAGQLITYAAYSEWCNKELAELNKLLLQALLKSQPYVEMYCDLNDNSSFENQDDLEMITNTIKNGIEFAGDVK